ncbi:hypothetical protein ACLB2K_049009 [Fragaria x ananassa]
MVGGAQCVFKKHIGKTGSAHYKSMQDWLSLKHMCGHIEKAINPQPQKLVQQNRLLLKATVKAVRLMAKQSHAFRGDDEYVESSNRGNIVETVDSFGRMNEEVAKLMELNTRFNEKTRELLVLSSSLDPGFDF